MTRLAPVSVLRLVLLASLVLTPACEPIASRSLTFDFAGQLLPTDVARPTVTVTNVSSWLPRDARSRLRMSTASGALSGPARTAVARAIVDALVREGLDALCGASSPPAALDASLAYASLCDPTTGRPRPFCVGIDRLSVAAFGGDSEVVDPPPLAAACGTTDATTTERGTVSTSGFSLAPVATPLVAVPLGPPTAPAQLVTFQLTVPRPLPVGLVQAPVLLASPSTGEAQLLPPMTSSDCRIRVPDTMSDCMFTVAIVPSANTLAPRDLTLAVVVETLVGGVPRNVPLFASFQLAVRGGTIAFTGCSPPVTADGQTTHRLQFAVTGGSVYVDAGFVSAPGTLEPVSWARVVVPGGPGPTRLDVGTTVVDVVEPSPPPMGGTVFDGRHVLSLETMDGPMRGAVVVSLPEGC